MWNFRWSLSSPPEDNREPIAALAIAKSLETEPQKWKISDHNDSVLVHESGISVHCWNCCIHAPYCASEPDANENILRDAIDRWIANRLVVAAS